MENKEYFKILGKVFSKAKYILISLIIAIVFYVFNVLVSNKIDIKGFISDQGLFGFLKILFRLSRGFYATIEWHGFVSIIIISILFGILVSLILYKVSLKIDFSKTTGILGSAGAILGALVPGCSACGVGIISLLGIGSGILSFLPFHGLEISVISIFILIGTIIYTLKYMYTCKVKLAK